MIKKITLRNPCRENWDDMKPAADGRFCFSCQKNVVDFSGMSTDEILGFIAGGSYVCGRIGQDQLESINYALLYKQRIIFNWRKFSWAAAMLSMAPFIKTQAKTFVKTEQGPVIQKNISTAADTAVKKIWGIVVASDDNLPIPGVVVRVKGANAATQTNTNGSFSVDVPPGCDTLEFSFIGYERQDISVSGFEQGKRKTALKMTDTVILKTAMMGRMEVRTSFFYRLWWHIKSPIVAIFRRRYH